MSRKALENTNEMCLCPLGILFKSNEFNMAAVSVKRSIGSPNLTLSGSAHDFK